MDEDKIRQEELDSMFDRLDHEVDLLYQAINGRGDEMEADYADKIARAQLESIGEVVESMSTHIGEGEKISVTTPSQLEQDEE